MINGTIWVVLLGLETLSATWTLARSQQDLLHVTWAVAKMLANHGQYGSGWSGLFRFSMENPKVSYQLQVSASDQSAKKSWKFVNSSRWSHGLGHWAIGPLGHCANASHDVWRPRCLAPTSLRTSSGCSLTSQPMKRGLDNNRLHYVKATVTRTWDLESRNLRVWIICLSAFLAEELCWFKHRDTVQRVHVEDWLHMFYF